MREHSWLSSPEAQRQRATQNIACTCRAGRTCQTPDALRRGRHRRWGTRTNPGITASAQGQGQPLSAAWQSLWWRWTAPRCRRPSRSCHPSSAPHQHLSQQPHRPTASPRSCWPSERSVKVAEPRPGQRPRGGHPMRAAPHCLRRGPTSRETKAPPHAVSGMPRTPLAPRGLTMPLSGEPAGSSSRSHRSAALCGG